MEDEMWVCRWKIKYNNSDMFENVRVGKFFG